ncbi:D5 family helicase-primase-endonuclease [Bodo saltans virus]|uniref:D5 family helicase-primase-endonuclease n=1 Tax=Bodo saltans virus TaxID=2024608 RepID=A0A2H4UTD3_9VIRU|nr:D5 family helicase-primase-endonuclease [Bodo saltans virus]ATZ80106.1 D5 family helicase-primase-endonuclease [Bodo saltans virus]
MKKENIPKTLRIAVWNKYIGEYIGKTKCLCCYCSYITQLKFECGHIIPESKGGLTNINNLLPICNDCNKSMGTKNLHEFKEKYLLNITKRTLHIENMEKYIVETLKEIAGDYFIYVKDELYCFNIRNKLWYTGKHTMKKYINDELYDYLFNLITDNITNDATSKNQLRELKNYCLKVTGQEKLAIAYEIRYKNETCDKIKFNENKYLFGFANGVYDLKMKEFRKYKYDDYIILNTDYNYEKGDADEKKELNEMLKKIMPDNDKRYLLLQILSTGLIGKAYQNLFIFNGNGGNGKSSITKLMKLVLGNYYYKLDSKYLLESSKQGANPELANLSYKRYVNLSEPPASKKIKNSIYKSLTGDGEIEARKCNSNDTSVIINATLILECNKRPLLEEEPTEADTRRIIDLSFNSRFTINDDDVDEINHIYKANKKYEDVEYLDKLKFSFFEILAENAYNFLCKDDECFTIPNSVKNRSQEYLNASCQYLQFLFDTTYKSQEKNEFITIGELFTKMKTSDLYLNSSKEERKKITLKSMIEFFFINSATKKFFKSEYKPVIDGKQKHYTNILMGYKFINNDDFS